MRIYVGIYVFVVQMRWIAGWHCRVAWGDLDGWVWMWMEVVLNDGYRWYKGLDSSLCSE